MTNQEIVDALIQSLVLWALFLWAESQPAHQTKIRNLIVDDYLTNCPLTNGPLWFDPKLIQSSLSLHGRSEEKPTSDANSEAYLVIDLSPHTTPPC
jgi:hypothetical protein